MGPPQQQAHGPWWDGGMDARPSPASLDLYWIPLGAGDPLPIVRWNGRLYEAVDARRQHRPACAIYHAALEVVADRTRYVIEMAPAWRGDAQDRGAVVEGPVGTRWLGRSRYFRYEVRRWRDGVIPDQQHAVGGAQRLVAEPHTSRRVLSLVEEFPAATWGRDEQHLGDMWNSNSLIAWLLARAGLDMASVRPPVGGRAPGWAAGLAASSR